MYFSFSRGILVGDMDDLHRKAAAHLQEASQFAEWSHKDREERAPPLTPEQDEQLRNYLAFVAENSPIVFPRHGEGKEIADMHRCSQQQQQERK
jgi:integrase